MNPYIRKLPFPLLVAVDSAAAAYSSHSLYSVPTLDILLRHAADFASGVFFWIGIYLLARAGSRQIALSQSRMVQFGVAIPLYAFVGVVILYHVLLWSFIVANGYRPSDQLLDFVIDNASRIPQHILQTSPSVALVVAATTILIGAVIAWSVSTSSVNETGRYRGRAVLPIIVMLVAWHVISDVGASRVSGPTFWHSKPAVDADARSNLAVHALPQKIDLPQAVAVSGTRGPVIVILVESLRHDLLETNPEAISFIRRMYDQHLGFSRAYATASHSNLSDLAFWFSQYPLRSHGKEHFPADAKWRGLSLFDVFKANGYRTAYISSQNELWGGMINWLDTPALDYFFDSESYDGDTWENFDDLEGLGGLIRKGVVQAGKVEDSKTLEMAKRWIDSLGGEGSFFLGMNLQNTHFSYVVTPGEEQPYQPSDLGFRAVYYRWPEHQRLRVRNRYLNSVRNVDRLIEDFSDFLRVRGLWDDALFVVVGDNGEAFYEHGFGNHSGPMYDEVIRTLAFMKVPASLNIEYPDTETPISHIDVAATVLDIAGLPLPWSFQGRSVLSSHCDQRPVFLYSNALVRQFGIIDWPWKYLVTDFPSKAEELYNLAHDPQELKNQAQSSRDESSRLRQSLAEWATLQRKYYAESAYLNRIPPDHCPAQSTE